MSRKNGRHKLRLPTPEPKSPVLVALEQRLEKAEKRLVEAVAYTDDLVSGWERERDEILNGGRLAGRLGARKDGDNWPYLRNMEDLITMRAASREACEGNGYGAGMLDRAVDFVVGDGMQPEVTLRGVKKGAVATGVADADGDGRPDADPAVENVMGVIEEFRRLNDWGMGAEDREEEGFRRGQRDGEVFIRFFAVGDTNGIPLVRWVEPEQVEAPPGGSEWRWGIKYRKINGVPDVESKEAIYVRTPDGTDGDWVPMTEMVYHKLGTDRTVLRGMPQFWLVARALYQSDALNSALAEVSAIQAKIAYVREHAPGIMPGQITDFVGGTLDGTGAKRTPYGDRYRRTGIQEEGTTVDMSAGMKFTAGPASTGVPAFVQALQSRLRQVCARFGYPEFFTGDASNNNYASSLTAGGPAEKAFKRKQHKYAAFQAAVYRRACEYAVADGRLSAADLAAVEIKVKASNVTIANKLEEAQVQQIRIQNKTLSPQTAMVENGHDPKVEMANIKAFDDQFGMGAMGMGGGGGGGGFDGGFDGEQLLEPTGESYTQDEYQLLTEADRSRFVRKTITNSRGRKQVVWVRAMGDERDAGTQTRQQVADARTLVAMAVADPNSLNPEQFRALAAHLETVPRDEIRNLLKQVGEKVGGQKVELANRLVEKVRAGRTAAVGDALARGDTPQPNPRIPAVVVDNPASVGNTTTVQRAEDRQSPRRAHRRIQGSEMNDVLLTAYLTALADGDTDTARGVADLAGDDAAVSVLLADGGYSESYTPDEHALLSEAARVGLVLKQVGTHPRTGKPIMRYVRATPKADPKQQKAAQKAAAMDAAREIVQRGIRTPKDARDMAAHLKLLTAKEIDTLKAEHGLKMKGRLKQDKVDTLVAYAQGRGSIDTVRAKPEPVAPKAEPKVQPTPTPTQTPAVTTPPPAPKQAPTPADTLPTVPADAATAPQKYETEGKAILNDQAVRQAIVDSADHLSQFVEYQHELYPMPRMYREVSKRVPGLTVSQFQAAMWQASVGRAVDLHAVNEVRNYPDAEKQGSIKTSDRLYQFVRLPQNATADTLKPKD